MLQTHKSAGFVVCARPGQIQIARRRVNLNRLRQADLFFSPSTLGGSRGAKHGRFLISMFGGFLGRETWKQQGALVAW